MGARFTIPIPPPRVIEDKYPELPARVNTNLSTSSAQQCNGCLLAVDTRVTTSSVTLTRDYGNVSNEECKKYQQDKQAVANKEMSFGDFLRGLAAGTYTRPVSKTDNGEFCEQILIDSEMVAKLKDYDTFLKEEQNIKGVRIRKVTGGGSFSSGSKVKVVLSLPLRAQYVSELKDGVPQVKEIAIRTMTLYHPAPIRLENVQYDAVLSLNDPSDETAGEDGVILIPLKGSNTGSKSEDFFNKIVKHAISLAQPSLATGMFEKVEVPTGAEWSLASLFWLGDPTQDGYAKVLDAYYSWNGLPTFNRNERSRTTWAQKNVGLFGDAPAEINFGWQATNSRVRYFMIANPVNIAMSDLSILTRNLPPTPPEQAIHKIPDSSIKSPFMNFFGRDPRPGWPGTPIVYKAAEGKAIAGACCGGVERTEPVEEGPKDLPSFGTESFTNRGNKGSITPNQIVTLVFGFVTLIFMMVGAAIALYFIHRNYDYGFRSASNSVGEVVGKWFAKIANRVNAVRNVVKTGVGVAKGASSGDLSQLTSGLKTGDLSQLTSKLGVGSGDLSQLTSKLGASGEVDKFKSMLGSSPDIKNVLGNAGSLLKGLKA